METPIVISDVENRWNEFGVGIVWRLAVFLWYLRMEALKVLVDLNIFEAGGELRF